MKLQQPQNLLFKPKLMLQVEKESRVIDASFRLYGEFYAKILKSYFCGIHGTGCIRERKMMLSVHPWVGTIKSLPVPNCLILRWLLWIQYWSNKDNELMNINVVKLILVAVITILVIMCKDSYLAPIKTSDY